MKDFLVSLFGKYTLQLIELLKKPEGWILTLIVMVCFLFNQLSICQNQYMISRLNSAMVIDSLMAIKSDPLLSQEIAILENENVSLRIAADNNIITLANLNTQIAVLKVQIVNLKK